jgi:3-oxoacyl-[acyl-carrier-protein] synthase III
MESPRLAVEGVGVSGSADTLTMLRQAGEDCLEQVPRSRDEVALVIHTGIYRSDYLSEPALAALAAGDLGINHEVATPEGRRTLAFDLMDGPVGTLHACHIAAQMLRGKAGAALVLASEVENNAAAFPDHRIGLKETAAAMLLAPAADERTGGPSTSGLSRGTWTSWKRTRSAGRFAVPVPRTRPGLEDAILECVRSSWPSCSLRKG